MQSNTNHSIESRMSKSMFPQMDRLFFEPVEASHPIGVHARLRSVAALLGGVPGILTIPNDTLLVWQTSSLPGTDSSDDLRFQIQEIQSIALLEEHDQLLVTDSAGQTYAFECVSEAFRGLESRIILATLIELRDAGREGRVLREIDNEILIQLRREWVESTQSSPRYTEALQAQELNSLDPQQDEFLEFFDDVASPWPGPDIFRWKLYPQPFRCKDRDCSVCDTMWMTLKEQKSEQNAYISAIHDIDATREMDWLLREVEERKQELYDALQAYGDGVMMRWEKATVPERREILLNGTPVVIPRSRWTEVEWLLEDRTPYQDRNDPEKNQFLPYLNADSLVHDASVLLNMINERSAHHPSEFIIKDLSEVKKSVDNGGLGLSFNKQCMVIHGPDYGQIVPWTAVAAHEETIISFPLARVALMAQVLLTRVLCNITKAMCLSGQTEWQKAASVGFDSTEVRAADDDDQEHEDGQVMEQKMSRFESFPFSVSKPFDPQVILDAATEQLASVEDDIRNLQTDPDYMQSMVQEMRKRDFYRKSGNALWASLARDIWDISFRRAQMWRAVKSRAEVLVKV